LTLGIAGAPLDAHQSDLLRTEHVEARMVGESTHIQPGTPYRLGLLLDHDEGWHTYWKSTATGYATSIDWELPEGFEVSGIHWPTPRTYSFQGLTDFVHEGRTLLMVTLTPPDEIPSGSVELSFTADWLMCADVCIPGTVEGSIRLPVRDMPPGPSPEWASLFAETEQLLPAAPGPYALQAWIADSRTVVLEVSGADLPDSVYYFDDQARFQALPEQAVLRKSDSSILLALDLHEATPDLPGRVTGVLRSTGGWPARDNRPGIAVDVAIQAAPPAGTADSPDGLTWGILPLAFAGGLILNLMPCVFPVLGIKIMGFVGQAGSNRRKVALHGLVFSFGVLLSFWVLAASLLVLRSGGSQLGWGFQLQSPGFVLALTFLLFAFALNMSGLFEIGQSAVGVGSNLTGKSGFSGSFFSGVLATVVATPCAAPFLAPALGAALTLPALSSIVVFTTIAIGLSTPYLVLSLFPGLINRLPRPGPWMETFKQFMSFLLYATVAYLLWVMAGQLTESGGYGVYSLLKVLFSLVIVAFALWIFGRWAAFHRPRSVRVAAVSLTILVLGGGLATGYSAIRGESTREGPQVTWEDWAPGKAEALAAEGKTVYVDFTARWCVTCQTNKATILSSRDVRQRFASEEVVTLKADWTNQDPRISQALARFHRSAVPFNLVYGPALEEPRILPEILTPGIVLEALDRAREMP
jgi:thiol:disulfide interchange protein DsbD